MKLVIAFFGLILISNAFAQNTPPRSGSAGRTISSPTNVNDPVPAPQTDRRRPQWNPEPTPTTPTPAPNRPTTRPEPRPRHDRYEPRPVPERENNRVYVGDYVLYQGREYQVVGIVRGGTLEVRTPFSNQRYFIPTAAVARTAGCVQNARGPVCVGDMTIGLNNIYYAVIGIEWSGRVVVQTTDVTRTVYGQIDPNSLQVVR